MYTLTLYGTWPLMEPLGAGKDCTDEALEAATEDDQEIQDEFGVTVEELGVELIDEFHRLREERVGYWSTGELLDEAQRIVKKRARGR